MLPILVNYAFVAILALVLVMGILSAFRPFIWWLLGIDRQIKLLDQIARSIDRRNDPH